MQGNENEPNKQGNSNQVIQTNSGTPHNLSTVDRRRKDCITTLKAIHTQGGVGQSNGINVREDF